MNGPLSAEFLAEPSAEWMRLPMLQASEVRIGVEYVGVRANGLPSLLLRLDELRSRSPFSGIACTGDAVFVGLGCSLYIASPVRRSLVRLPMCGYFGSLASSIDIDAHIDADTDEFLLFATSASQVYRLTDDGAVKWISKQVGIDGVVLQRIVENRLHGSGEWDPPDGWASFVLDLDTGQSMSHLA